MKNGLKALIIVSLLLSQTNLTKADTVECGQWNDVPSDYIEILTQVCEYGLMQGESEDHYGFGMQLSRAQAAVVVSRFIMGSSEYDDLNVDEANLAGVLSDDFSDVPTVASYNEYAIKAMYYASLRYGIMEGDNTGSSLRTFRPFDTINIPETFKVFFEAAKEANLLSDHVNSYISYSSDTPWYEDLMELMNAQTVIWHLDTDYESFWVSGGITKSYVDFGQGVKREDAAIFVYNMVQKGLIDETALTEKAGLDVPTSNATSQ